MQLAAASLPRQAHSICWLTPSPHTYFTWFVFVSSHNWTFFLLIIHESHISQWRIRASPDLVCPLTPPPFLGVRPPTRCGSSLPTRTRDGPNNSISQSTLLRPCSFTAASEATAAAVALTSTGFSCGESALLPPVHGASQQWQASIPSTTCLIEVESSTKLFPPRGMGILSHG